MGIIKESMIGNEELIKHVSMSMNSSILEAKNIFPAASEMALILTYTGFLERWRESYVNRQTSNEQRN